MRVEFGDLDVLDNDVACSGCEVEAFALDDAFRSDAYERLVGFNRNGVQGCVVVVY